MSETDPERSQMRTPGGVSPQPPNCSTCGSEIGKQSWGEFAGRWIHIATRHKWCPTAGNMSGRTESVAEPVTSQPKLGRCTLCGCERIPLDREKTRFGVCTFIECKNPTYDLDLERNTVTPQDSPSTAEEYWPIWCAALPRGVKSHLNRHWSEKDIQQFATDFVKLVSPQDSPSPSLIDACAWREQNRSYTPVYVDNKWQLVMTCEELDDCLEAYLKAALASPQDSPQPRWIPVSEKLPKSSEFVWIVIDGLVQLSVAKFGENYWHMRTKDVGRDKVSHWMPLPAPPVGDSPNEKEK